MMSKLIGLIVVAALSTQWKPAEPDYAYAFPKDHAAHPENKIEWWYYTGNLDAKDGRRFGFQVTFFRIGLDAAPANPSKWAVRDLYMTHLAVSDVRGQRYRFEQKLTRGGPGLAGAATDRYFVWNEGWTGTLDESGRHVLDAPSTRSDRSGPLGLHLVLEAGKRPVIHGRNGISQKGAKPGNASHYYSLTRMPTSGTIMIDGETVPVTGMTWMDHEFGTTFLEPEQRGWDWLSIQLEDGREVMLYQMRRADGRRGPRDADSASWGGSHDPRTSGTFVAADGRSTFLADTDFTLTPKARTFTSKNGAVYPIEWALSIPSQKLELTITTPLANQELTLEKSSGVAYWEGLIDITGSAKGRGYLEMTGYYGSLGVVLSGR